MIDSPVAAANCLKINLETISKWAETWLVPFNPTKTESLLISRKLNKQLSTNYNANSSNNRRRVSQASRDLFIKRWFMAPSYKIYFRESLF